MDCLSVLDIALHFPPCIKQANLDFLSGTTSAFNVQIQPPKAQLAVRLLACKDTAGNEQPHVLLTFKLEAVETNISVCLCLESDLQSLGAVWQGRGAAEVAWLLDLSFKLCSKTVEQH